MKEAVIEARDITKRYKELAALDHVDIAIRKSELQGQPVWEVCCHRVTMGKTPDKQVFLDYMTLGFVQYQES